MKSVRGRTLVIITLLVVVTIAVSAIALPLWQARHRTAVLDDYGAIPAFALTDDAGRPATDAILRGHVTIVNFVFTRCDTACPVSSMKMRRIQDETSDAAADIKLLSFSVDPAYDTPPRLAEYARRYEADPSRWRFVTGPIDRVRVVVTNAMKINMEAEGVQASGAPNIVHEPHFLLIDQAGRLRGFYDSTDAVRLQTLVRDARDLARS